MAIPERETLAFEGVVVVAVDVIRPKGSAAAAAVYSAVGGGGVGAGAAGGLTCRTRITTRAMWTDNGRLMEVLHSVRTDAPLLIAACNLSWWFQPMQLSYDVRASPVKSCMPPFPVLS
jgi:hypothetical protein